MNPHALGRIATASALLVAALALPAAARAQPAAAQAAPSTDAGPASRPAVLPLAPARVSERPLWELGAGAGLLSLPHYRGAEQSHTWLLPVPYVVYRGRIFKADRDGARAVLLETDRLDFDLSLAASAPTRSEDNDARAGMADLSPTVEIGPNLNLLLGRGANWKLDLRVPVRAAITIERSPSMIGWTSNPHLNLDQRLGGWNLGLQGGPLFATRRYHATTYDVRGDDVRPDRPAYRAPGGYGGLQFTAAASRRFGDVWLGAFVRHDRLDGAVFADSPLVRDRHTWSVGLALTYVFARSDRLVPVED